MKLDDLLRPGLILGFALTACDSKSSNSTDDAPLGSENAQPSSPTRPAPATDGTEPRAPAESAETTPSPTAEPGPGASLPEATNAPAVPEPSTTQPSSNDEGAAGNPTASSGGATTEDRATGGAGGEERANDPCATSLLCDDFDADVLGMPPGEPWQSDSNGGAIEVSNERSFSGDKSVHVSNTEGAYKRAYFSVQGEPVFPAAGSEMYGRMMMWLDATPQGSVHWTFIQGEGPADDGSYDVYYRYGGQHDGRLMANFETQGVSTDCWDHSETVMPTQTWTCLEWRFDTANDELQFWLDGVELTDIHVIGSGEGCVGQDLGGQWPAPAQFDVLRLGWEKYQQSSALDLWIDDVIVSTARVGCPGP